MRLRALVTGGGGGIGLAIARALCDAEHDVVILGRDGARLDQALRLLPRATAHVCDVTDDEAIRAVFAAIQPIQILVNNAGGVDSAPFEQTTMAAWTHAIDLNLLSCVRTIQAVAPEMRRSGFGRIVNIASTAALKGYPYVSAYVAAKHAVVGLTRSLALEYAQSGVTVNCVCPGYTDTEIVARAAATISAKTGRSSEAARSSLAAANPQGRLIAPDEVAAAVLWLTSTSAAGVNGAALPISGGEV